MASISRLERADFQALLRHNKVRAEKQEEQNRECLKKIGAQQPIKDPKSVGGFASHFHPPQ